MEKKRLIWADSLKGWLIILVVLGHAIQNTMGADCESSHLWNLIYSFHMPAFMAASGFLAFRPIVIGGGASACWSMINRRFQQLIIPFLIWTALLMLIKGSFTWNAIKTYLLYPDKGLWFLWVLFFINVFFVIGSWLAERMRVKQEVVILLICLLLVGVMVAFEPRLLGFQFITYYFLFYALGYYLHKYEETIITKKPFVITVLTLCWFVLAWFWKMHELPSWLGFVPFPITMVQYAYRFITAAIAVYILLAVSPLAINNDKWMNKPFMSLGAISLGIYTTHFILIGRIVKLFSGFEWGETMKILVTFIVALIVSWLIVWLLSKWKFTARYMLGKI